MKKLLLAALCVVAGFCANAKSTVCNLDANCSVEIQSVILDAAKGVASVSVGNDSEAPANVTVEIEATYSKENFSKTVTRTYTGKLLAKALNSTSVDIKVPKQVTDGGTVFTLDSVVGSDITGRKCQ